MEEEIKGLSYEDMKKYFEKNTCYKTYTVPVCTNVVGDVPVYKSGDMYLNRDIYTSPMYVHTRTQNAYTNYTPRVTTYTPRVTTYTHTNVPQTTTTYTLRDGVWYPNYANSSDVILDSKRVYEIKPFFSSPKKIDFIPRLDIVFNEKKSSIFFFFDLPDFEKKDVQIEVDKNTISVSGERKKEYEKTSKSNIIEEKKFINERIFGFFCRKFQLPKNALEDEVKATMADGVLTIQILCDTTNKQKKKIIVT